MNDPMGDKLSAMGQSRRQAMLDELVESMDTLHRRRRVRRRVGSAVGFSIAVCALVVFGGPSIFRNAPSQVVDNRPASPDGVGGDATNPPPGRGGIEIIRTRPEIVARYAPQLSLSAHVQRVASHRTSVVEVIGDKMLLKVLAQMDRPAGLIRADGKVWLTAPVTDAELEAVSAARGVSFPS